VHRDHVRRACRLAIELWYFLSISSRLLILLMRKHGLTGRHEGVWWATSTRLRSGPRLHSYIKEVTIFP
jgi:hypothetical protein